MRGLLLKDRKDRQNETHQKLIEHLAFEVAEVKRLKHKHFFSHSTSTHSRDNQHTSEQHEKEYMFPNTQTRTTHAVDESDADVSGSRLLTSVAKMSHAQSCSARINNSFGSKQPRRRRR